MKLTSISEVKKELQHLQTKELVELCLKLAKYKNDNKDFFGYLLFHDYDKPSFIKEVKLEIDIHFEELKLQGNLYYVKKGLRKLLRIIIKYCKYLDDKALNAELHIYFLSKLKKSGIPYHKSQLLINLYEQQVKKINSLISKLHQDLQQDYVKELSDITE